MENSFKTFWSDKNFEFWETIFKEIDENFEEEMLKNSKYIRLILMAILINKPIFNSDQKKMMIN